MTDTLLPAVNPGWQMVPVEATEAMLDVLYSNGVDGVDRLLRALWSALLAAAPKPPVEWDGKTLPYDWVAVRMEFDGPDYPEDYAYGPPRMMNRLRGVLERYYAVRYAPQPPVQETARNPDVLALNAAREIMALMYGPTPLGGSPQLLAQVQCVVSEAIVYAAPKPSDDVAKNAARYRWLCEYGHFRAMSMDMGGNHSWTGSGRHIGKGESIDAAIDAAMAGGGK